MELNNLEGHILAYFRKKDVQLTYSAVQILLSPQYLIPEVLDKMDAERVINNVNIVLYDIIKIHNQQLQKQFRIRRKWWRPSYLLRKSLRNRQITDADVKPVLDQHFGKLPPYSNTL